MFCSFNDKICLLLFENYVNESTEYIIVGLLNWKYKFCSTVNLSLETIGLSFIGFAFKFIFLN